jgi:hypothetical protein
MHYIQSATPTKTCDWKRLEKLFSQVFLSTREASHIAFFDLLVAGDR